MDKKFIERMNALELFIALYNSLLLEGVESHVLEKEKNLKEKIEKLKKVSTVLKDEFEFDYSSDEAFLQSTKNYMNQFKN